MVWSVAERGSVSGWGRTRVLIGLWIAAALMAMAYSLYWGVAASRIQTSVADSLDGIRGMTHRDIAMTGWPWRHTMVISDLSWENRAGAAFAVREARLTASPFNPLHWMLDGLDSPVLGLPGGPRRKLQTTGLEASVRLSATALERVSVITEALVAMPATAGDRGWSLGASAVHLVHDDQQDQRYGMSVELGAVTLSAPVDGAGAILGDVITSARLAGPLDHGEALNGSLQDWQAAGGRLTVMAGSLLWGPLSVTGVTGNLALDADGRWQGQVAGNGALLPDGVPVPGLSRDVSGRIRDGTLTVLGLPLVTLPEGF